MIILKLDYNINIKRILVLYYCEVLKYETNIFRKWWWTLSRPLPREG